MEMKYLYAILQDSEYNRFTYFMTPFLYENFQKFLKEVKSISECNHFKILETGDCVENELQYIVERAQIMV